MAGRGYNMERYLILNGHLPGAIPGWSWWQRLLYVFWRVYGHWPMPMEAEALMMAAAEHLEELYFNLDPDAREDEEDMWQYVFSILSDLIGDP